MQAIICRRGVRLAQRLKSLGDIPDLKDVRLVMRYMHLDCEGIFLSLQYALYFNHSETYTVDLPQEKDWQEFEDYLNSKFKEAGINPPILTGTLQDYSGEESFTETQIQNTEVE